MHFSSILILQMLATLFRISDLKQNHAANFLNLNVLKRSLKWLG